METEYAKVFRVFFECTIWRNIGNQSFWRQNAIAANNHHFTVLLSKTLRSRIQTTLTQKSQNVLSATYCGCSRRTMDASPFAELPPELRNEIYCLVLKEDEPITLNYRKWPGQPDPPSSEAEHLTLKLGLAHTCREIYFQSQKYFYAANDFIFQLDGYKQCRDGYVGWGPIKGRAPVSPNSSIIQYISVDEYLRPLHYFLDKTSTLKIKKFGSLTVDFPSMPLALVRQPCTGIAEGLSAVLNRIREIAEVEGETHSRSLSLKISMYLPWGVTDESFADRTNSGIRHLTLEVSKSNKANLSLHTEHLRFGRQAVLHSLKMVPAISNLMVAPPAWLDKVLPSSPEEAMCLSTLLDLIGDEDLPHNAFEYQTFWNNAHMLTEVEGVGANYFLYRRKNTVAFRTRGGT
jgi:hypothetical protein